MDPISLFFSSYVNAVSNAVHKQMTDMLGTEVQAVLVEHNEQKVGYHYQLWKIQDTSVCGNSKGDMAQFSQCTLAAKSLFEQSCRYLQERPADGWQYLKLKNMYCQAAISFKPTLATIAWSQTTETEVDRARKECSLLTAAALDNPDTQAVTRRDTACRKYRELKSK